MHTSKHADTITNHARAHTTHTPQAHTSTRNTHSGADGCKDEDGDGVNGGNTKVTPRVVVRADGVDT